MGYKESDEAIVAMKYVKAYGAKGRNTLTFLVGKHKQSNETKKKLITNYYYGNKTARYEKFKFKYI